MNIPKNAHVLVIDGRKLLLFQNDGGPSEPHLSVANLREHKSARTEDQGTDRPGRTHASVGGSHSAYEETDFHQLDEDRFAAEAARLVNTEVLAGHIEALIIVAAPKTLGELRKHYHPRLQACLLGEIAKDMTGRTTQDITTAVVSA